MLNFLKDAAFILNFSSLLTSYQPIN